MRSLFLLTGLLVFHSIIVQAQKIVFTKNATISFHAGTAFEDIDGINKSVTSVLDPSTGKIEFAVLMKGFEFKRSLMQDHFNENYVESDQFPKATFKGQIVDLPAISFATDGTYNVMIKGDLEIHGVKKNIEAPGIFTIKNGVISGESDFVIALDDYKIRIPSAVSEKISPTVKIHVSSNYKPL